MAVKMFAKKMRRVEPLSKEDSWQTKKCVSPALRTQYKRKYLKAGNEIRYHTLKHTTEAAMQRSGVSEGIWVASEMC